MAAITVTYSNRLQGWTSFFSYHPEWMIGLNNTFYSMSGGNLYRHRDDTVNRNTFYGVYGNSGITGVFNTAPMDAKMFKTIGLETTSPWEATLTTDLEAGQIQKEWFVKKEGDYYANIRRNDNNVDLDLMSAQGIGTCAAVTGAAPGSVTINFGFTINSLINIGDVAYKNGVAASDLIGTITAKTANSITVAVASNTPVVGNLIIGIKDSVAESYGARGYYMEVQLTNSLTTQVELFSMSSEVFKSYP